MPGFGDLVQKAVYLGVGLASVAGEKATKTLAELRTEAQKLADELVKRGEMTADEARRFVEDALQQAQDAAGPANPGTSSRSEPRRIEILDDEDNDSGGRSNQSTETDSVDQLRQRVKNLQDELQQLQRKDDI
ncbi:MAG: phasin family protein [Microcoleaceae cyanobacterium]